MFLDKTSLLKHNPPQSNYGVAVLDLDGDGAFELFVSSQGWANLALKWDGKGFTSCGTVALADAGAQAISAAAGDLDGDGREELFVLNSDTFQGRKTATDRLFDFRDGEWVDLFALSENRGAASVVAGRSVGCIDRMGTGRYSFVVASYGGPLALFETDDQGRLQNVAARVGLNFSTGGRAVLCLPLLSERPDIFVGNEGGANFLFRNRGDGTFDEMGQEMYLGDMYENARGVAALDLDGDGRLDIALANWEGPHRLFVRRGDVFRDAAPPEFSAPSKARTLLAADFDNDGCEELFLHNMGQPNRLLRYTNSIWRQVDAGDAQERNGLGTGGAVGDFDGDGRLELILSHGEAAPQPLSYFHAPENDNGWLRVLPLTRFGAPARGALVRLAAGGREQIRHVDAGSGYLCQMEPVAHFGLGAAKKVDWIEVLWPDGAKQRIDKPDARQVKRVEHPG